ncbi:GGDEF domain-containing protein [Psychrosphaera sp. F3M07]|uniref:tetratricopeptide repeat-containing diguanylate cyclase n=1 Tax=Psychrosphaera sp. F3M07 TaxID=2841560 RepID=UPI001C0949F7|nr:diguanylate cyclase [Psychrosphaera sp. F3M07]MBU2918078.1 GGDEF domain-containing protein [Psychrosphaera sp. F3M07]
MVFQSTHKIFILYLSIVIELFALLLSSSTFAADTIEIEQRFRQLEHSELIGGMDKYREKLLELQSWLDPNNNKQQNRYNALDCWVTQADTAELLQSAIIKANKYLSKAQEDGDKRAQSDLTLCRGVFYQSASDDVSAERDYNTALNLATEINNIKLIADSLSTRASLAALKGDLAQALEDFQLAQTNYELANIPYWAYYNLSEIGNTYRRMGDFERALSLMDEVEQFYEQSGNLQAVNDNRYIRALIMDNLGNHSLAQELYAILLADAYKKGDEKLISSMLVTMADSLLQADKTSEAKSRLNEAEPMLDPQFDPNNWSLWHLFSAKSEFTDGNYESALAHIKSAEPHVSSQDNYRYLAWIQNVKAKTLAALGDWQQAYKANVAYNNTQELLASKLREQNTTRMRIEFDAARKEAENKTLKAEQSVQKALLQSLEERKRWQALVIGLSLILLTLILIWAYRQFKRARLMHKMAMTDELTRLPNRRSIQAKALQAMNAAREAQTPMSLLVFDVDYFKRINDTWGHEVGDRVLQKISTAAQLVMRKNDSVGRTGGEEFMVVLPDSTLDSATEVAQRLCDCVAAIDMQEIDDNLVVTISLGVAQLTEVDTTVSMLTQRADNALYRAKDAGRNRVEVER